MPLRPKKIFHLVTICNFNLIPEINHKLTNWYALCKFNDQRKQKNRAMKKNTECP